MIRIKRGLDLPIAGEPAQGIEEGPRIRNVALIGFDYNGLKPTMAVQVGDVVRLGQVATVIDGFEDTDIKARFNGQPAALVQVNRTNQEDVIAISDTVRQYVADHRKRMPGGIQLATWFDLSTMVRDRIDLLLRNAEQLIRENVELVTSPIEEIHDHSIETKDGEDHPIDVLVLATGFDAITGGYDRIDIRGVDGIALSRDGQWLYYAPLNGGQLYRIATDILKNESRK